MNGRLTPSPGRALWFGRLDEIYRVDDPNELVEIAYPKGYSLESILANVSGERAAELKQRLLPVFIDFVRIDLARTLLTQGSMRQESCFPNLKIQHMPTPTCLSGNMK